MGPTLAILLAVCCLKVSSQDIENYRLPSSIIPTNYDIEITPYFVAEIGKQQFTFDGFARIFFHTTQLNVMEIVLHSVNLNLTELTRLTEWPDIQTTISVGAITDNALTQKRTFQLTSALKPNQEYILTFNYIGYMNSDMNGFYRSSYMENGVLK